MVRLSYYQPEGNPVDITLLPPQPMPLRFAYIRQTVRTVLAIRNSMLRTALFFDLLYITTAFLYPQLRVLAPLLALSTIGSYVIYRDPRPKIGYVGTAFLALAFVSHIWIAAPIDPLWTQLAVAAWLSLVTYNFGMHWIYRCTVSPIPCKLADELIKQWWPLLLIYSSIPILLFVLGLLIGTAAVFQTGLLALIAVQLFSTWTGNTSPAQAIYKSFTSYLSYNSTDEETVGGFISPAGGFVKRSILLIGSATLLASSMNRDLGVTGQWPIPSLLCLFVPALIIAPLSAQAHRYFGTKLDGKSWRGFVRDLRKSVDSKVRNSIFAGRVAFDGMPVLYPFALLKEHMHILGSSGSSKTSKGLLPIMEQVIEKGDMSVVCLDLKGDTFELMACMQAAVEVANRTFGRHDQVQLFSSDSGRGSQVFNPLATPTWKRLSLDEKVSLLATAANLTYGEDYGPAHFDALNTQILRVLFQLFPNIGSFREMLSSLDYMLKRKEMLSLGADLKQGGPLIRETIYRLSTIDAMQVVADSKIPSAAMSAAVTIEEFISKPTFLYMHLPSVASPKTPPAIARLFLFQLLEAARRSAFRIPVVVFIDEFQRIVAPNIKSILQQAHSMGVGLIVANQSMQDLKSLKTDLIPSVESNCRFRQWFDCGVEDKERLIRLSGDRVEQMTHIGYVPDDVSLIDRIGTSETILPRLNTNEINHAGDHPRRSIVHIKRGEDYARFSGTPFILESDYHITKDQYQVFVETAWPIADDRFVSADDLNSTSVPAPSPGPIFTGDNEAHSGIDLTSKLDRLIEDAQGIKPTPWCELPDSTDEDDNA